MATTALTRRKNVDWKNEFIPIIKYILAELACDDEKPSVRGMWYILVSRYPNKIPNIPSMYSSYDKAITKARKGEYGEGKSRLEEDAFVDNVRHIIDIDDVYETARDYIQRGIYHIAEAHKRYTIPRWDKQCNYLEVWLEKDALVSMFRSILSNREVRIVPNRGWTSRTFLKKNIDRLMRKYRAWLYGEEDVKSRKIIVLYFGDFDPSGLKMDEDLKKELSRYDIIEFKRVAITKPQIQEFDLEHLQDPDPETLEKLEGNGDKKGDSNTEWFKKNWGDGQVYQIELDAMHARREQFKELVLSTVDQYFDNKIYQREVKKPQEKVRKNITAFANRMIEEQFPLEEDRDDDTAGGEA
jgi:hypothetical protein